MLLSTHSSAVFKSAARLGHRITADSDKPWHRRNRPQLAPSATRHLDFHHAAFSRSSSQTFLFDLSFMIHSSGFSSRASFGLVTLRPVDDRHRVEGSGSLGSRQSPCGSRSWHPRTLHLQVEVGDPFHAVDVLGIALQHRAVLVSGVLPHAIVASSASTPGIYCWANAVAR